MSSNRPVVLKGRFLPHRILDRVWTFCVVKVVCGGAIGIYWVEARNAVKQLTMRRTVPPN